MILSLYQLFKSINSRLKVLKYVDFNALGYGWGSPRELLPLPWSCFPTWIQTSRKRYVVQDWSTICSIADVFTATTTQNSNMTMETAQFFPNHNSKRVKIRYGPFTAPPLSVNNGMGDWLVPEAQKPCTDCLITWILAGLEYPNGTDANADTGLWLHHTVFSNTNRTAAVCPQAKTGDDFFASGNERTPANICVNGYVMFS